MFQFPPAAEFNRPVPKSKIYTFGRVPRSIKDRFVSEIHEIVWQYKLAPETVNLPARSGIEEIQVFTITLKGEELGEPLLLTIDKAIPSPIIYQLMFRNRMRFTAAYKRPSEAEAGKHVVESYFATPWQSVSEPLPPLPVVLDLAALYEAMLRRLILLPARSGESLVDLVDRVTKLRAKERELVKLDARLRNELQFNRKVLLNANFRSLMQEIDSLKQADIVSK